MGSPSECAAPATRCHSPSRCVLCLGPSKALWSSLLSPPAPLGRPGSGNGSGTGIGNGSGSGSGSGGGGSGALRCERTHSPAVSCGVVVCGSLAGGAGAYSCPLSRGVLLMRLCVCGVLALCVFCVLQCVHVCVMCVMCGR